MSKDSVRQSKITKCPLLAALGGKGLKRVLSMITKNVLMYNTLPLKYALSLSIQAFISDFGIFFRGI